MWRVLIALLLIPQALAAGEVAVDAARSGGAIDVSAHADLDVDVGTAWQVLTDYDRYASFIPGLAVSRVVTRDATSAIVEQKGEARFLFFRYPIEVRLAVAEVPLRSVTSHAIGGNLRELRGRYELEPLSRGVRLHYTGRIVLAEDPPGLIDVTAVRLNVARQFEALVHEIERGSGVTGARSQPDAGEATPNKG